MPKALPGTIPYFPPGNVYCIHKFRGPPDPPGGGLFNSRCGKDVDQAVENRPRSISSPGPARPCPFSPGPGHSAAYLGSPTRLPPGRRDRRSTRPCREGNVPAPGSGPVSGTRIRTPCRRRGSAPGGARRRAGFSGGAPGAPRSPSPASRPPTRALSLSGGLPRGRRGSAAVPSRGPRAGSPTPAARDYDFLEVLA